MRTIPAIDTNRRRSAARTASAVIVSSALVFASLGLPLHESHAAPAQAAFGQDEHRASAAADKAPETDGILIVADAGAEARALSADEEGAASDGLARDLQAAGLKETKRSLAHDGSLLITAQPADDTDIEGAVAAAESIEGVANAQPNYVYRLIDAIEDPVAESMQRFDEEGVVALAALAANDPFAQISDPETPRNQYWLYSSNFDDAWNEAQTDGDVAIAVLDTGVMADHRDLAGNVSTEYGWDAYEGTPLYADGQNAFNGGHGTAVAGAAAAVANNGFGMAGASFNASVIPVKVCDDNAAKPKITSASLTAAYDYVLALADSGKANVRVVNLSLGAYGKTLNDRELEKRIVAAKEKGIVTVCAGGNGDRVSTPRTDPLYPADFDACVAVTALREDGSNLPYSDYNASKDISAPGESITVPRADTTGDTEGFTSSSGTSLAAPIVSAAFALMFAAEPGANVDEAKEALCESATPVEDPEDDRTQTSGSHGALDAQGAVAHLTRNHSAFSDVAPDDWFFKPVHYVSERGIMNGYDGAFHPDQALTREQAAQILYNRYGNGALSAPAQLSDVDQDQWYASAVNWAVESGMMVGLSGTGTFGIGSHLSREQLALVVARAAKADLAAADPSAFNALPDHGAASPWARDALVWATDEGVINGDTGTNPPRLLPQSPITRAQMAQVVMNAMAGGIL